LAIFKRPFLLNLVSKIKLWPSKRGVIHGIREIEDLGAFVRITTYCGTTVTVKESRRGRGARWLRNRWVKTTCPRCAVPSWKIERFTKSARNEPRA